MDKDKSNSIYSEWLDKLHSDYETKFGTRHKRCDESPIDLEDLILEQGELNK